VSSLVRRIRNRLMADVFDLKAHRAYRRELEASPRWNKPLLKPGRPPRALRRSKRSQKWLEERAKDMVAW
jgi:hypothetical protein